MYMRFVNEEVFGLNGLKTYGKPFIENWKSINGFRHD